MSSPHLSAALQLDALGSPVGEPLALVPVPLARRVGSLALVIVGVGLLVAAALLAHDDGSLDNALFAGVPGLVSLAAGLALLMARSRQRCTLTLHDLGVSIVRGGKVAAFAYAELTEVALSDKEALSNGNPTGRERTLTLATASQRQRITNYFAFGPEPDGFGAAVGAIVEQRAKLVMAGSGAQAELRGKGWSLVANELRTRRGALPLSALASCDLVDGELLLWKKGEAEPSFRVAADSSNGCILYAIAAVTCQGRDVEVGGLGRILFTRATSRAMQLITTALVVLMGGGFAAGIMAELSGVERWIAGAVELLAAGAVIVWIWRSRVQIFQLGVRKRGLFGSRELRFSEVVSYTQATTRHYHNGAYTGTTHAATFKAATGKAISHRWSSRGSDEELERVRDHVSQLVAATLGALLAHQERVTWSGSVQLAKDGIHYREARLIGAGGEAFLPYATVRYSLNNGRLDVFGTDAKKPAFSLACSAANFFPGLALMEQLAVRSAQQAS